MSNTHDTQYSAFHLRLLENLVALIKLQPPFSGEFPAEEDASFVENITRLTEQHGDENFLADGQQLICKIVAGYPHLMPVLPRDLLWFFGGDCLHYMPDEEIQKFQQLDERRQEAIESKAVFNYADERARIFSLH
jgi:hypothetical protein